MPRGRLPTGIVLITWWLVPSMTVTVPDRSLLTYTWKLPAAAAKVVTGSNVAARAASSGSFNLRIDVCMPSLCQRDFLFGKVVSGRVPDPGG